MRSEAITAKPSVRSEGFFSRMVASGVMPMSSRRRRSAALLLGHKVSIRVSRIDVGVIKGRNLPTVVHLNLHQEPALRPYQAFAEALFSLAASAQERDLFRQALQLALVALLACFDLSLV